MKLTTKASVLLLPSAKASLNQEVNRFAVIIVQINMSSANMIAHIKLLNLAVHTYRKSKYLVTLQPKLVWRATQTMHQDDEPITFTKRTGLGTTHIGVSIVKQDVNINMLVFDACPFSGSPNSTAVQFFRLLV
jgi:hypothetical protein